jgi:RNA polymerase sigma-70 factor (ECF subfamily)
MSEKGETTADEQAARRRADAAMERYAQGDEAAFGDLYDVLAPRLRRFALLRTGSTASADDLIQQTMLQLHLHRGRYVSGSPVFPWAFAIARNLLVDAWRGGAHECGAAPEDLEEPEDLVAAPDELLATRRRGRQVAADIAALPGHLREALTLTAIDGLTVAEAAAVIGVSCENVKVRTHRARKLLAKAEEDRQRTPGRSAEEVAEQPDFSTGALPLEP